MRLPSEYLHKLKDKGIVGGEGSHKAVRRYRSFGREPPECVVTTWHFWVVTTWVVVWRLRMHMVDGVPIIRKGTYSKGTILRTGMANTKGLAMYGVVTTVCGM